MRCRTLARKLQQACPEVCFICRRQPGDLISLLEQEFPVLALPEQLWLPGMVGGRDLCPPGLVALRSRMPPTALRFFLRPG